jgi:ABC-type Fe3+-siderophore transport system permease subunit
MQPHRGGSLQRADHPAVVAVAALVGIALVVLAFVYWLEPAASLPSWLPGHEAGSGHHHVKHGIASFLVGAALLVFAWFQTGGTRTRALPPA